MKETARKSRLPVFDFLRALAILYIVGIRHMDGYAGDIYHGRVDDVIAYSMLGLFVFISGYLLNRSHPVMRDRAQLGAFLGRRFLRIYPLYLVALLAFRLCSFVSPAEALQHAVLLNIVLNSSAITLWFVSMLCVFYLLFPLINRSPTLLGAILVSAAFFAVVIGLKLAWKLVDVRVLIFYPLFLAGILASRHSIVETWFPRIPFCLASSGFFLAASWLYFVVPRFRSAFLVLFMVSSLPALFLLARLLTPRTPAPVYRAIAYASYGMYLFHHPVFTLMIRLYRPAGNVPTLLYLTALGIPLLVGVTYGIQTVYDCLLPRGTGSAAISRRTV